MKLTAYRAVLSVRDVRRILLVSLVIRIPLWAGNVVLTLHVVTHLHRDYAAAGAVVAAATTALAISSPWRGRRLDRVGLRATIVPSLVILTLCWSIAPWVGYWPLLVLAAFGSLFNVPTFSIVRQALMHAVDESARKSALAIDSVVVELSFMIGPALGVLLATYAPTPLALFVCELSSVLGGLVLFVANPQLRAADAEGASNEHVRVRSWLSVEVVAILVASASAVLVLSGTDVGVVAALRHLHHQPWIGWELAVWGLGSAVGGFVYGAIQRTVPVALLLGLLAATTLPVAAVGDAFTIAVLLFVTGAFCAPTITATIDALSRAIPERVRGEALGWHGSAMTVGSAAGAPIAGVAVDHVGWPAAFWLPAVIALVGAAVAAVVVPTRRGGTGAADSDAAEQLAEVVGG